MHLFKKGFDVTAVDLAPSNIEYANQSAAEGLQFMVHDMRNLLSANTFDYVFNLFTLYIYMYSGVSEKIYCVRCAKSKTYMKFLKMILNESKTVCKTLN